MEQRNTWLGQNGLGQNAVSAIAACEAHLKLMEAEFVRLAFLTALRQPTVPIIDPEVTSLKPTLVNDTLILEDPLSRSRGSYVTALKKCFGNNGESKKLAIESFVKGIEITIFQQAALTPEYTAVPSR